jgi:hypothetical protein
LGYLIENEKEGFTLTLIISYGDLCYLKIAKELDIKNININSDAVKHSLQQ